MAQLPPNMIKNPFYFMSLRVARGVYNPEKDRFHFYVSFKPTLDPTDDERGVEGSHSVEVALSVTETGELADVAFSLPEPCRSRRSLEYLNRTHSATLIEAMKSAYPAAGLMVALEIGAKVNKGEMKW